MESYRTDGENRQPISGRRARLRFEDGRIGGSGGCNRLMGSYELNGDGKVAASFQAVD